MFKPAMLVFRGWRSVPAAFNPGKKKTKWPNLEWHHFSRNISGSLNPLSMSFKHFFGAWKFSFRLKTAFHYLHFQEVFGEFPARILLGWWRWHLFLFILTRDSHPKTKIMFFYQAFRRGFAKNVMLMSVCVNDLGNPLNIYNPFKLVPFVDFARNKHVAFWRNRLIVNQKTSVSPFHLEFSFQPICKFECFFILIHVYIYIHIYILIIFIYSI